jgi:hypothetical protein
VTVAGSEYEQRRKKYMKAHKAAKAVSAPSYEGFSSYNDNSTAASFQNALKEAAREAVKKAGADSVDLPAWYEVTRVRILVGNPNVKVLGATITWSAPQD